MKKRARNAKERAVVSSVTALLVTVVVAGVGVAIYTLGGFREGVSLAPAEFEVSSLTVSPSEVKPGESVNISIDISNVGEEEGTYLVELKIDGIVEETENITLGGGEGTTVSFTVQKEAFETYSVGVEGLSGSFEVLNPGPTPSENAMTVEGGNNQLAFDLYSRLVEGENNVFFSPWSIYTALAMTYEGARGETAEEMESVLHLPENDNVRRSSFARILGQLNENKEYELETANALWAQENYPFLEEYMSTVQTYYAARISNLDFVNEPEEARETINNWASEKTRDKIEKLIEEGMINPFTRLILTNAIYFKGKWVKQFDNDATCEKDFWVEPGKTVKVSMMSLTGENAKFNYTETDNLKVLEMPYEGKDLSMLVLLPKSRFGLSDLENNINPSWLDNLRKELREQKVNVYMPKFELKPSYDLKNTLKEMGMTTAFTPSANFSGMDGTRSLFIDFVVHKAFVKVDEEGTEAAAATGVGMAYGHSGKIFYADHPFMFIIQNRETGNILFLGRVVNPSE